MFSPTVGFLIMLVLIIAIPILIYVKTDDVELVGVGFSIMLIVCLLATLIGYGEAYADSHRVNVKYVNENKQNVYSIGSNIGVNGNFVLGYGQIDSDLYYYVMTGDDKNGYTVQKYNASQVYLIPEDVKTPYYVQKYIAYTVKYGRNFVVGGFFKPLIDDEDKDFVKEELHLPKNYIKQNYNISIK